MRRATPETSAGSRCGSRLLCTTVASAGEVPTARAKNARASGVSVVTFASTYGVPATVSGPAASGTYCAGPAVATGVATVPAANALSVPSRAVRRHSPSGVSRAYAPSPGTVPRAPLRWMSKKRSWSEVKVCSVLAAVLFRSGPLQVDPDAAPVLAH